MDKKDKQFIRMNLFQLFCSIFIPAGIFLLGLWISTQQVAASLGYQPGLGQPLIVIGDLPVYFPLNYIIWALRYFIYSELRGVFISAALPFVICLFLSISFRFVLLYGNRGFLRKTAIFGSGRLADRKDLKKNGFTSKQGIVVGQDKRALIKVDRSGAGSKKKPKFKQFFGGSKIYIRGGDTSVMVIGPPRAGKSGFVVPTILEWKGPMFIKDPKGELYNTTAHILHEKYGYKIVRISYLDPDNSSANNILDEVRSDLAHMVGDAEKIAGEYINSGSRKTEGGNSAHFKDWAKDLLKAAILHVLTCPAITEKNMPGILSVFSNMPEELENLSPDDDEVKARLDDLTKEILMSIKNSDHVDPEIHTIIGESVQRIANIPFRERGAIISTMLKPLLIFQDPPVRQNARKTDFLLSSIRDAEDPIAVFFCDPFSDDDRLAGLFRTQLSILMRKFSESMKVDEAPKPRLLVLLEEFPLLGDFNLIQNFMGLLHGFGLSFLLVAQSKLQIDDLYGQKNPFWDLVESKVYFPPGDNNSARWISDLLGNTTVYRTSSGRSGRPNTTLSSHINVSIGEAQTKVMLPEEVNSLGFDKVILHSTGMRPAILKKIIWWEHRRYKKLIKKIKRKPLKEMAPESNANTTYWHDRCREFLQEKKREESLKPRDIGQWTEIGKREEELPL